MKIVILERNSVGEDVDVSPFESLGEVVIYPTTPPHLAAERIKDADIVVANKTPLTKEVLETAANLKLISEFATGYDNIDVDYCKTRGIAVTNVSGYSTDSVAQHTLAMALYLEEHLFYYNAYVKSGAYSAQDNFCNFDRRYNEFGSLCWGIIGMGAIGQKVAHLASAFGAKVIYCSISGEKRDLPYEQVSFEEILKRSDILSLHCMLSDQTRHLIGEAALSKMKKNAILLNVARGAVVDTKALYQALKNDTIGAAGLDVLEKEPMSKDDPLLLLQDSEKLIITPHMAWGSTQARTRLVGEACENIRCFLQGEKRNRIV
ncbi:MAG: D-2-hydroxyacid dehydrogenase [Lachnospiraceae bacterium]|nr:D-2-hydroxyacid dehydrogenase [Lachnospiraceae bacterium]